MTQQVSIADISRLLDGEVSAAEKLDLEARLADCALSQALFARLRSLNEAVGGATIRQGLRAVATSNTAKATHPTEKCLSDLVLIGLADNTLSETLRGQVEAHILHCESCLSRVLADLRTAASMTANTWPQIPPALRQKMNPSPISRQSPPLTPPEEEEWQVVEISLAEENIQPVECVSGQLRVRLEAVVIDAAHVRLDLTVRDGGHARAGQVFVVINSATKQKISTNRSNSFGRLTLSRLALGSFNIYLQGTNLRLDLTLSA